MKNWVRDIIVAFFAGVILPTSALRMGVILLEKPGPTELVAEESSAYPVPQSSKQQETVMFVLFREKDGLIHVMNMDTYLIGAVLAEMPASFEPEALKAQAVAARTYALRARETNGKHGDGSVCGSYACCQAYLSPAEYLEQGGRQENVDKIRDAVYATSAQVLTYDGALIEATYFSSSGGKTEDAVAVWGYDYPYLKSVESPGEEESEYHSNTVSFTLAQFQNLLGIELSEDPSEWIGNIVYTAGGGVASVEIGDVAFKGTQVRSLLGLYSTAFEIDVTTDSVFVSTRGYGHRVGMSQYGADAMAVQGCSYTEILAHYYPGTDLSVWKD